MKGGRVRNAILSIHRKDETFTKDKKETAKEIMDFFKKLFDE